MLDETKGSECLVQADQCLMGDACKDLREAYGHPPEIIAETMGIAPAALALLEAQCSVRNAIRYRVALMKSS